MDKIELQTETNLLLAKQIIDRNNCSLDILNWALLLMQNDYYSENLSILVGLDASDFWNIDLFFKKTIDDLNIVCDLDNQTLLDFYLIEHIKRAINNPLQLDTIIYSLSSVLYDTSYHSNKHLDFFLSMMN